MLPSSLPLQPRRFLDGDQTPTIVTAAIFLRRCAMSAWCNSKKLDHTLEYVSDSVRDDIDILATEKFVKPRNFSEGNPYSMYQHNTYGQAQSCMSSVWPFMAIKIQIQKEIFCHNQVSITITVNRGNIPCQGYSVSRRPRYLRLLSLAA